MDLQFLHGSDPVFWIGLLSVFGLVVLLYRILPNEKWYPILLGLRAFILLSILFLLLNPVLTVRSEKSQQLNWAIFADNSASINNHKAPSLIAIQSGLTSIVNQLSEKNIDIDFYRFDTEISKENKYTIDGNGVTTNLGLIPNIVEKDASTLAGAIVISDGLITEGKNPLDDLKQLSIPIHTIGIGAGSELVDVSVQSIDVPTVVLKSDGVQVKAIVQSMGQTRDRLSVSLYQGKKLLGSKHIRIVGQGAKKEVQFRFTPKEIGQQNYEVRISSVEDEINIVNNRQSFHLMVLKDQYKVALITGSPNKNTSTLKRLLKKNPRIQLDHYIRISESRFKPAINSFWSTPYELIILDNYPIKPLSANFIRILGKKVVTHQSAMMLLAGPNQSNHSLKGLTSILGVTVHDSINSDEPSYWEFASESADFKSDYSPLTQGLNLSTDGDFSEELAIYESGWPLWARNQNGNIRTSVITATDLHVLHYQQRDHDTQNPFSYIINGSTDWLLKSGGAYENYFRLNKNRYQQGEMVQITGTQPFTSGHSDRNASINIYDGQTNLFSRDITYNIETNRWEGVFRAPKPGNYTFVIQMGLDESSILSGQFQVLESQIELSQVYLNKPLLTSIAKASKGQYVDWQNRSELIDSISQKVRREFKADVIKFNENKTFLIVMILFLCIEWIVRRQKGLS
tara:strand:+ start:40 stop:2091 length:2052 start_codon:yes stop_codon:yes gene_type:complete